MNTQNSGSYASQDGHDADISDVVKAGVYGTRDKGIWPMPHGMDVAARQAREAADRFSQTLGFSGEESERLSRQTKQNTDAVKQCRSVLTKAFQTSSESWLEMVQGQWKRNFDGLTRLMQAKSVHEFGSIQGELVRENLEHILKDSRSIAEHAMLASEEAGKSLTAMTKQDGQEPA